MRILFIIPVLWLAGCQEILSICADSTDPGSFSIQTAGHDAPLVDGITVVGTASHGDGGALLTVALGGHAVTSTSGNFTTWKLDLTHEQLVDMRAPDDTVRLPLFAESLCGTTYEGVCDGEEPENCLTLVVDPTATPQSDPD